ncbi:MAG: ATP-dependent DNA ligase [Puniceicoccaceae bacterium]|jgi:DNA ligase-1|nr:ATP-dependent DNA ligase [Puniceicoccaceae bacterium]|tara:strand:+ start:3387 stop:5009 length:1623 start_codon:yes stop_codon:yes gene_type:complete
MDLFTQLFIALDQTNKTVAKSQLLSEYFEEASPADAAWAIYFLMGERLKRLVKTADLKEWACRVSDLPDWLFAECYDHVGDLAETLALLIFCEDKFRKADLKLSLSELIENYLIPLKAMEPEAQSKRIVQLWSKMDFSMALVLNKLITGGFRVGVSKSLVIKALAKNASVDPAVMAHKLMGQWEPSEVNFKNLFVKKSTQDEVLRPYPFCLAYPLEVKEGESLSMILGDSNEWQIEPKWDGIRAQIIVRKGARVIWSRGEQLLNEQLPEIEDALKAYPDEQSFVLDGEILAWDFENDKVRSFADLQKRLGRKKVSKAILEEIPVVFMAYDLLEIDSVDLRAKSTSERRDVLEKWLPSIETYVMRLSPIYDASRGWEAMAEVRSHSREESIEGLMLKQKTAIYSVGRKKGLWWKWKIEPYTVDAVMVYAQQGHGRRAGVFSDYTFSIWKDGELVPFCKAYSGLSDMEMKRVDKWIRANTTAKHGPVRVVQAELVFEIAFEGIQESKRHKSGIAVRFPRIHRWREDKLASDADTLETVKSLL